MRIIDINVNAFKGLCPKASYVLSFNRYNYVGNKCRNVGRILRSDSDEGNSLSIVNTDHRGKVKSMRFKDAPFTLISVKGDVNIAIGSGSCVLKLLKDSHSRSHSCKCPEIICAPVKLAPIDINAGLTV